MRLILVRHGHTAANEKRAYNGHNHHPLTLKGMLQVRKLGLRLKKEAIAAIYSSDLLRARQTAKHIAKHHPLKVITTRDFREVNFGKYEGTSKDEICLERKDSERKKLGVETALSLRKRAAKVLTRLMKKHYGKTIVLVGHGAINWAMHNVIHKKKDDMRRFRSIKPAALSIYKISKGKPNRTLLYNSQKHLQAHTHTPRNKKK